MRRRQVLRWSLGLGAAAGTAATVRLLLPPRPSRDLPPAKELAAEIFDSLDEETRAAASVPYDHPLRQYYNRGVDTAGVWSVTLGWRERALVTDLFHAGLSELGRERVPEQLLLSIPGIHLTRILFCGRPEEEDCQVLLTGPHLNLRIGGPSREGAPLGGPQVYGDQTGDGTVGLPGNAYRYQLAHAQKLWEMLTEAERGVVRQAVAPPQTCIDVQGSNGTFEGIPVADLSKDKRQQVRTFLRSILENYPEADASDAWACIEDGGGVESFFLADYDQDFQGGRLAGGGASQIFRLEAPGAVFYYRGEPHLHAFLNVARDPDSPLSLGEDLGSNPRRLDGPDVARFFDTVLGSRKDADLGYYPRSAVAGRLRAGPIRSGDIYNLESWRENVVHVEIRGSEIQGPAREALGEQVTLVDNHTYRIATIGYVADNGEEAGLGAMNVATEGGMLRDVTIDYLRANDFPTLRES